MVLNLPLMDIAPAIIIFEAIHISKERLRKTFRYLHSFDYYTLRYGQNGLAFKLDILKSIPEEGLNAWGRQMKPK